MKDGLSCWKLLILFQNIWVTNSRSVTMFEQCWNLMRGISSTSYNFVSNRSGPASHLYPFVAFRYRFGQLTSTFVGSFVSDSSRFVSRMAPKIPSVVVVWVCLLSANPLFTKGVMLCTIWQEINMQCFDDTLMPAFNPCWVENQRVETGHSTALQRHGRWAEGLCFRSGSDDFTSCWCCQFVGERPTGGPEFPGFSEVRVRKVPAIFEEVRPSKVWKGCWYRDAKKQRLRLWWSTLFQNFL